MFLIESLPETWGKDPIWQAYVFFQNGVETATNDDGDFLLFPLFIQGSLNFPFSEAQIMLEYILFVWVGNSSWALSYINSLCWFGFVEYVSTDVSGACIRW